MKRRYFSYIEIVINGVEVGFSSVAYHYFGGPIRDTITAELLLFQPFYQISGIQVAREWPVYEEDHNSHAAQQDETLTRRLLKKAVTNYDAFTITFKRRRDVFDLDLTVRELNYKCLLIHEFFFQPPHKQVQILPENKIIRYSIDETDANIIEDVRSKLSVING